MWYRFGQQLTLEKDFTGTSLGDIVKNAINNWLENSPYWQIYRNHNAYLVYKQIEYVAKEKGDMATKKLMQALNTVMLYDNNDASFKNLLEECADHPAVKQIAQKYGFTEPSRSFYSYESMQDIVTDWYKAEYRIRIAKEQGVDPTPYEQQYKKVNRELANMILAACRNWYTKHKQIIKAREREQEKHPYEHYVVLETRDKIDSVMEKLSDPNVSPLVVNWALNTTHNNGSIFEHTPFYKDQKEEYERPMRKFMEHLNNISNNDPIVPEVEREMDHNLINQFFPVEERTKTAKCKNVV